MRTAEPSFEPGHVWLVGAGPGSADLLTRRAEALMRAATVIFHDALVGSDVLALAGPGTRLVPVGKRAGRHSQRQERINAQLLEAAQGGEKVVRLKGGDPSVFGRSAEEVECLRRHGITVRICPGITAASAAAASAGVSLTLRGVARKLSFVTAAACAGKRLELDWASLADPESTLAVYMGKAAASRVARALIAAGMPPPTPALIVEDASLPTERQVSTRLDLLGLAAAATAGSGPMVLLIGKAVSPTGSAELRSGGLHARLDAEPPAQAESARSL